MTGISGVTEENAALRTVSENRSSGSGVPLKVWIQQLRRISPGKPSHVWRAVGG